MKYIKLIHEHDEVVLESDWRGRTGIKVDLQKILVEDIMVTLTGDWNNRYLDFVEVLKLVQKNELQFRLCTDLTFDDFKLGLGIASFNKTKQTKMKVGGVSDNDKPMLIFMGAMLIDFYLKHTGYYVETVEDGEIKINKIDLPNEGVELDG